MSILSVLDVARSALSAQQFGVEVTGHNIANVNTPEFSRQNPIITGRDPSKYAGLIFGRGVDVDSIVQTTDAFVEKQLRYEKSGMLSSQEMENYTNILEGLFNENSDTSISSLLSGFWNSWQDISNNPSGVPERIALFEQAGLLSEQLNALNSNMTQMETDLTSAVSTGIEKINQITNEISILNGQIVSLESDGSNANDLRDQRTARISELAEYLDVKTFEQNNGSLTVVTSRGGVLVSEKENFELQLGGTNGDRVLWENSSGSTVDITDYLANGKLGGWLEMRDEIIAKYKLDLDALTKEFVWSVNEQHSQGVGLNLFDTALTGTYESGSSGLLATLSYGNKIDYTKDFKMWTYDSGATSPVAVNVDMGISTAGVADWGGNFTTGGTYTIMVTQGGSIADYNGATKIKWNIDGGAWTTVDVNADGTLAAAMDGNATFEFDDTKALVAGNTLTFNALAANTADKLTLGAITGTANDILDTYTFTVTTGGTIGTDTPVLSWSNSITSGTLSIPAAASYTVDGMTIPFASGTLAVGDTFTITTDANGTPTTALPSDWHWTLDSFVEQFNRQTPRVTASKTSSNALTFTPYTAGTDLELKNFVYSNGVTAANTTLTVNNYDALTIAGADVQLERTAANTWQVNNNPGYAVTLTAIDGADLDNGFYVDLDGTRAFTVTFGTPITSNGIVEFDITAASGTYSFGFSDDTVQDAGLTAALGINTFFQGSSAGSIGINTVLNNKDNIAAAQIDASTGDFAAGDNSNALAIADLQFTTNVISQWTTNRVTGDTEGSITATVEGYYNAMVGSIGVTASSISRAREFSEVMVNKLSDVRDSISAVSLDEEMANLIKYQHAYAAAAKLINVSDEMYVTLLQAK